MKCSNWLSVLIAMGFASLVSLWPATTKADDADHAAKTFAATQSDKNQRAKACRARYRDCLALKQIPSFECRAVYEDCIHSIV
jgi:hypothetical protein